MSGEFASPPEPEKKRRRGRKSRDEGPPPPMVAAPVAANLPSQSGEFAPLGGEMEGHDMYGGAEPEKKRRFGRKKKGHAADADMYETPMMPATYPNAEPMPPMPPAPLAAPYPAPQAPLPMPAPMSPPPAAATLPVSSAPQQAPAAQAPPPMPAQPAAAQPPMDPSLGETGAPISEVMSAMGGGQPAAGDAPQAVINPDTGQTQAWTAQSAVVQQVVERQRELADEQAAERRAATAAFAPAESVDQAPPPGAAPPPAPAAAAPAPPPPVAAAPTSATQAISPLSLDDLRNDSASEETPGPAIQPGQGVRPVPPEFMQGPED